MKNMKKVLKPGEKCDCPPNLHRIAKTAWSAFSGYELTWSCQCGATWKTRSRANGNAGGRVF